MKSLHVKLKNCYGIDFLEHEFDFSKANANIIYAPNGAMKSSLAKTFSRLADGKLPEERLFNKESEHDIKIDQVPIKKDEILVIHPFDKDYESKNISALLVDSVKKARYDIAYKEILEAKKALVAKLNKISKITKENIEAQLVSDFSCVSIFDALELLRDSCESDSGYAGVPYTAVFDSKVIELLGDESIISDIAQYTEKYNELLDGSPLFSRGVFNPSNAATISKALKKEKFFEAKHKVLLNGRDSPVVEQDDFEFALNEASDKVFGDGALKTISKKIIDGVASVKTFQDILAETPQLALDLSDLDGLRKKLWLSYYKLEKESFDKLLDIFNKNKEELAEIEKKAELDSTLWHEAKNIFKERFHVPFDIEVENHTNAVLGTTAPNIVFTFKGNNGEPITFSRGQLDSLDCLSVGERRAMYLMYVIFEFKARLHSGKQTIVIVDDIADSFDYKNKYAIIEYLKELSEEPLLRFLVLTHNFDFYRTFQSRILGEKAKRETSLIAQRDSNQVRLTSGGHGYTTNPFEYWKERYTENPSILIAMIPFVRNLIEYKESGASEDYMKLTSMLHIKSDTRNLKIFDLEAIVSQVIKPKQLSAFFNKDDLILDLIYLTADNIVKNQEDESLALENKIVLSIAIRLHAEEFMWKHVQNQDSIKGSQTGKLFDRLCKENKENSHFSPIKNTLTQVSLMTPENIHLNSFMYEPLMDISTHHLVSLLENVRKMSWPEPPNIEMPDQGLT